MISTTELGRVFRQHHDSLPMVSTRRGLGRDWPWIGLFLALPLAGTVALNFAGLGPNTTSGGLLAGIGVLGGLLFGVLALVSSRIATIADGMDGRAATPHELSLITRLDIARANIAYATLVSIVFVTALGVTSMLHDDPKWLNLVNVFLLLHFSITLVLVLLRINSISEDDRVTALTDHARGPLPGSPSTEGAKLPSERPGFR